MKRGGALQNALLILVPALLLGLAVFATARTERDTALGAANAEAQGQQLLTAMLDQETGARGFFLTRDPVFLQPWYSGTKEFRVALRTAQVSDTGEPRLLRALDGQASLAAQWHADAVRRIDLMLHHGRQPSVAESLGRKALMDRFRAANAHYHALLARRRNAALAAATVLTVVVAVVLSVTLALAGLLFVSRRTRREERLRRRETELRELLQVSESEQESHRLLIRYIEQTVPRATAGVLNRNNSDDRLEVSAERSGKTPLAHLPSEPIVPRACLAIRLSRPHHRQKGERPLAACAVCGKLPGDVACEPLLVGGKVIGSVLVAGGTLTREALGHVRGAVDQAAPIIANQRSLSVAQLRAASDVLTGLPNRRAADETLRRMLAQAGRTLSPLAAVMIDLDHFKEVNDIFGHDHGDDVLAAVGAILRDSVRESDFAARFGGEEFLLLLPGTTREQAATVAEKVRAAIAVAQLGSGTVTASLGVAAFPEDAIDAEQLLRRADRALYAAKEHGRDRIELAEARSSSRPAPSQS